MAPRVPSAFFVRSRLSLLTAGALIGIAMVPGCSHHRKAYRPIYAVPAAPVVPAPPVVTPACPPGAPVPAPGVQVTPTPPLVPAVPAAPPGAAGDEPSLKSSVPPPLTTPSSSRPAERLPSRLTRRLDLRARVEPFVDDADDLFE